MKKFLTSDFKNVQFVFSIITLISLIISIYLTFFKYDTSLLTITSILASIFMFIESKIEAFYNKYIKN